MSFEHWQNRIEHALYKIYFFEFLNHSGYHRRRLEYSYGLLDKWWIFTSVMIKSNLVAQMTSVSTRPIYLVWMKPSSWSAC